ncbi:MAG TPA: vitamin K epoxide reductase family protein [Thermoleophilaceae bacterium]|nr:vitamin K epoxide reductase family protein [Thermoleophilaceae bacterium]
MTKAIAGLALLGLAISIYLTYVHYAGIEPVCSSISNCERVQTSEYADLAGIPVAVLGIAGYAAILLSLRMRADVTALLSYLAVAFSAYLTWAELFKIDAICQWCVASAIITLVIAVLATVRALGAPLHQRALS